MNMPGNEIKETATLDFMQTWLKLRNFTLLSTSQPNWERIRPISPALGINFPATPEIFLIVQDWFTSGICWLAIPAWTKNEIRAVADSLEYPL